MSTTATSVTSAVSCAALPAPTQGQGRTLSSTLSSYRPALINPLEPRERRRIIEERRQRKLRRLEIKAEKKASRKLKKGLRAKLAGLLSILRLW
jgi:hypothetical protein